MNILKVIDNYIFDYTKQNGKSPTRCYLGTEDFSQFQYYINPCYPLLSNKNILKYKALDIFIVKGKHHIFVA